MSSLIKEGSEKIFDSDRRGAAEVDAAPLL
jgi:hypothetical protein